METNVWKILIDESKEAKSVDELEEILNVARRFEHCDGDYPLTKDHQAPADAFIEKCK